jgi:hypothetical protein
MNFLKPSSMRKILQNRVGPIYDRRGGRSSQGQGEVSKKRG